VERTNKYGKFTISAAAGLGEVDRIWVVSRQTPWGDLSELAKIKLEERTNPSDKSWDEKRIIKGSFWILEERDGDFFCDCPSGLKVTCMITL
jgi:hypothetical protein